MSKVKILIRYFKKFGFRFTTSYMLQRLLKRKVLALRLPNINHNIYLRNSYSDFQVFTQIFLNEEYKIEFTKKPDTIIDCGANIGLASLFFLSKFPECKIIAVEPEYENFKMLKKNLSSFPNTEILHKAVWSNSAYLSIVDKGWGEAGFIVEECDTKDNNCVEAISINDIVKTFSIKTIDLLKIDIEGSEEQLFQDKNKSWLPLTSLMFIEIHENLKPNLKNLIFKETESDFNITRNGEFFVFNRKTK